MSPIGLKCRTTAQARVASLKRYDDPESDLTFPRVRFRIRLKILSSLNDLFWAKQNIKFVF